MNFSAVTVALLEAQLHMECHKYHANEPSDERACRALIDNATNANQLLAALKQGTYDFVICSNFFHSSIFCGM